MLFKPATDKQYAVEPSQEAPVDVDACAGSGGGMRKTGQGPPAKLEELPNIGKSIASDLRAIGILLPNQLAGKDPLATYVELSLVMGRRHDPCVLYVLISAQHFLESGEALPWWRFTEEGKKLLASISGVKSM